ncbi:hypothetical protein GE09DRAFT_1183474 [Coniochaeta sp. 2T2.1]|nr:hypothetical protein GE09DRAFT_1183474 [Coniochaeta sp. 2T2.1]
MLATTFIFAVSPLMGSVVAESGKCHGQRLYCGSSLHNMKWSDDAIWAGLSKGKQWYPNELNADRIPNTLFECDGRSGADALWWRSSCADNGCHDGGAGHSDYCQ